MREHKPLSCLQADIDVWLGHNNTSDGSLLERTLGFAEEVDELCRVIIQRHKGTRNDCKQFYRQEVRRQLADVHLALLALAEREGIDLHTATCERWTTMGEQ